MDSAQADAYLARIDAPRLPEPTAAALRDLQLAHLRAVPFENLSIPLREDIVLEEKALYDKIVGARRGGFCYEVNGAFAALLAALGYDVTLLAARVFIGDGRLGPPYDHLALRVLAADDPRPRLADVGFGRHARHPLRYDDREDQPDPEGVFRILDAPAGDLDVQHDGTPVYRLEQRPRELADFEATSWYQQTSPRSHFARSVTCSRLTDDGGRLTLGGATLIRTAPDGRRTEEQLPEDRILPAYREHFGIELDRVPPPPPHAES